ncbi:hypothetical protein TREAZ_0244 [Leadbettera azotonutricia ZAS-9]|uniref:Uncharacterized protein n=1 Tax=Leadbettera azotonutricia (strain ATCC BAA-888 / DSM 13862 / ZAS-9) TaxID=545695 RepID=F5YE83_LEAAZ|nr:hypothetical protein TREAZ_0244 [Leadbettera azotonutricia ZAS-9]
MYQEMMLPVMGSWRGKLLLCSIDAPLWFKYTKLQKKSKLF